MDEGTPLGMKSVRDIIKARPDEWVKASALLLRLECRGAP